MRDVSADPRFARIGLRTDCPRCGAHLPVNGPAPAVDCAACGHTLDLPDGLLAGLLTDFEEGWPDPDGSGTVLTGDLTWRWTAVPVDAPTCLECQATLPQPSVMEDHVVCSGCGAPAPVAPLDASLRHAVKTARFTIGGFDDLSRPATPPEPVALACPQCGAGLTIDIHRERLTRCEACSSQIHVPDAVWRLLHPPREVREWFVRFDGEGPAARRAREQAERARRQQERQAAKAGKRAEKEARRQAQQAAEAEKSAQRRAQEQAEAARRLRLGRIGLFGSWVLTLAATATMGLSVATWAAPGLFEAVGLGQGAQLIVTEGMVAMGIAAFALAWIFGHLVAAWRARLPLASTLFFSAVLLPVVMIPAVGMFGGLMLAGFYLYGRFPTPPGEEFKNYRHPTWSGAPLAWLLMFGGVFATAAAAITFDMTVWEMLEHLPED